MSKIVSWVLEFAAAGMRRLLFVAGLRRALPRMAAFHQPGVFIPGGHVLRVGLFLCGLALVADGHWKSVALGLAGFVAGRIVSRRLAGPARAFASRMRASRGLLRER